MKHVIPAVVGMLTLATGAFAASTTSSINGKTFFASADCGLAKAWPAGIAADMQIKDCDITLAVDATGNITYTTTATTDTFQGFAQDVSYDDGSKATGLFFSDLNGAYIPLTVAADGNSVTDANGVLTLSATHSAPSILLNRSFTGQYDCGLADTWYLNDGQIHVETGTTCNITLAFDGMGDFSYTTENGAHKGTFQQRGQEARLAMDTLPAGFFFSFQIAADNNSLSLPLNDGSSLTLTAVPPTVEH